MRARSLAQQGLTRFAGFQVNVAVGIEKAHGTFVDPQFGAGIIGA
ncbi:hypothetical protein [Methylomonas sp. YC3]